MAEAWLVGGIIYDALVPLDMPPPRN